MRLDRSTLWVAMPLLASAAVHRPILSRFFRRDDFIHLYEFVNAGFLASIFAPNGGHVVTASNAVFYLLYRAFGLWGWPYFAVALATHLAAVALLFRLLRQLTGSALLATFGAALWGASPVAQGSLGWFSVYGHVLAAPCLLWVLGDVARLRASDAAPGPGVQALWALLLVVAGTSFGVGAAVAMAFPALLWLLLPAAPWRWRVAARFCGVSALLVAWYVVEHAVFAAASGTPEAPGNALRYVLGHWRQGAQLLVGLLAYGSSSLLLGPFGTRAEGAAAAGPLRGPLGADVMQIAFAVAALFAAALALAAWRADGPGRRRLGGYALLAVASYALVALGRAGMHAFPHTARYHYVGPLALVVLLSLLLASLPLRGTVARRLGAALLAAWLAVAAPSYLATGRMTAGFAGSHAGLRFGFARAEIASLVRSATPARAASGGEPPAVYLANRPFQLGRIFPKHMFPGWAAVYSISFPENTLAGKRVYFVERDFLVLARVKHTFPDGRISELMIAPQRVPAGTPIAGLPGAAPVRPGG